MSKYILLFMLVLMFVSCNKKNHEENELLNENVNTNTTIQEEQANNVENNINNIADITLDIAKVESNVTALLTIVDPTLSDLDIATNKFLSLKVRTEAILKILRLKNEEKIAEVRAVLLNDCASSMETNFVYNLFVKAYYNAKYNGVYDTEVYNGGADNMPSEREKGHESLLEYAKLIVENNQKNNESNFYFEAYFMLSGEYNHNYTKENAEYIKKRMEFAKLKYEWDLENDKSNYNKDREIRFSENLLLNLYYCSGQIELANKFAEECMDKNDWIKGSYERYNNSTLYKNIAGLYNSDEIENANKMAKEYLDENKEKQKNSKLNDDERLLYQMINSMYNYNNEISDEK